MLHHPRFGAYTELYSGISPDVLAQKNGSYFIPWGREFTPRPDLLNAMKSKEEGGTGIAAALWDWCKAETASFS